MNNIETEFISIFKKLGFLTLKDTVRVDLHSELPTGFVCSIVNNKFMIINQEGNYKKHKNFNSNNLKKLYSSYFVNKKKYYCSVYSYKTEGLEFKGGSLANMLKALNKFTDKHSKILLQLL